MEETVLDDFRDDFALLIEAGFVAVKQLDEASATRLFRAAQLLNPDSPASAIGLGYIHLNKLEVEKAIQIFQQVLEREPDHLLAMTFLGLCYVLKKSKRGEGEALIKEAMANSEDSTVKHLCVVALEWLKKDFLSAKAPFFEPKESADEDEE